MTDPLDLEALRGHTPGPWDWVIHDQSLATLGVPPDPGLGDPMVMNVSPCGACAGRVTEWQWGNCGTPKIEDARLIAAAPTLFAEYERLLSELTTRRARDAEVGALVEAATATLSHNPAHYDTDEEAALRAALLPFQRSDDKGDAT